MFCYERKMHQDDGMDCSNKEIDTTKLILNAQVDYDFVFKYLSNHLYSRAGF